MKTKGLILVVDDDRDIRDSLRVILESAGYAVSAAADSEEALAAMAGARPDLMILDIMMAKDTEGFDFAHELKKKPEFEKLPIIILTSFLEKVRGRGAEEFQNIMGEQWPAKWLFEKPVDTKKLLAKVERILAGT